MPTPQRYTSVRSKPSSLRPIFRLDSSPVAFRYEQTIQAEPPIHITAPSRPAPSLSSCHRRPSTISSSTTTTTITAVATTPSSPTPTFVVVIPRRPPPQEEHPALRARKSVSDAEGWKRDSGLAPTIVPTTSIGSATIRVGEDDDEYDGERGFDTTLHDKYHKLFDFEPVTLVHDTASAYPTGDQPRHDASTAAAPHFLRLSNDRQAPSCASLSSVPSSPLSPSSQPSCAFSSSSTNSSSLASTPHQPSTLAERRKKLVKSFSLRTGLSIITTKRLRKRSIGHEDANSDHTHSATLSTGRAASEFSVTAPAAAVTASPTLDSSVWFKTRAETPDMHTNTTTGGAGSRSPPTDTTTTITLAPTPDGNCQLPDVSITRPDFSPLSIAIPDDRLLDDDFIQNMSFSQRGSVMFGGRRAVFRPSPDPPSQTQDDAETKAQSEELNAEANRDSETPTEATDVVSPSEPKSDEAPTAPTRQPPTVPSAEPSTSALATVEADAGTNVTTADDAGTETATVEATDTAAETTTEAAADAATNRTMETIEEAETEAVAEETEAIAEETAPEENTESAAEATPEVLSEGETADVSTEPTTTEPARDPMPTEIPTSTALAAPAPTPTTAAIISSLSAEGTARNASTNQTAVDGTSQTTRATAAPPSIHLMPADVERDSQKVRSLYESGDVMRWEDGGRLSPLGEQGEPDSSSPHQEAEKDAVSNLQSPQPRTPSRSASFLSPRPHSAIVRREHERAGGMEDWEDVQGGDVDRYGFITPRRPETSSADTPPTELRSTRSVFRRRNGWSKRDGADSQAGSGRGPSRKVSARSLHTQTSEMSTRSRRSARSAIRQATNLLPHNRNRRWMDEAGDMLTLMPGIQDVMEDARAEKISEAIKKKESERAEKWRKMAKVVKKGGVGEGMVFEFDVKSPKLIERTWKGIPDRWRSSAWYSFLAASAREKPGSPSEEQIIADFNRFQSWSSPDDVQIDLDVPRTVNRHVMFRRRYRGGQRLLFRVLHALSLYFPHVGYVQGMASLAATLLCYYDEEKCFVMLVRMWQLRGLERLYRPGFEGLMTALGDFETQWLRGKPVAQKLKELCIDPTAYGTRWYLTLFNLTIPFQAQLRVWDVFLLLGDSPPEQPTAASNGSGTAQKEELTGIEIVHATSAALIDALGDVLLDSDFENAMKALTSWIPIKDEDLLMKVTKAEWKAYQSRKKA
ncbi:hypothetical protein ACRALDRAFT_1077235 [Sodiomyces alcalophilus JCM 7366]|uniref:uncharacterized protein n=1 Tax=Sodiomyces alcalophilus JCM 7366 TaxID=591952 RepID=UPI0039B4A4A0